MESLNKWAISLQIDFSQFPEDISNSTKEELQDIFTQLNKKLMEIQNEFEAITKPNLKVRNIFIFAQYSRVLEQHQFHSIKLELIIYRLAKRWIL